MLRIVDVLAVFMSRNIDDAGWDVKRTRHSFTFSCKGRVARYAHAHRRLRRTLWHLGLLPNVLGPFYRSDS